MSLTWSGYRQATASLRNTALTTGALAQARYRFIHVQGKALQTEASAAPVVLTVSPADHVPGKGKLRLDAFLTAQLQEATRGKLQACIKAGNVTVNGQTELKTSLAVRAGDVVHCTLLEAPILQAIPEVLLQSHSTASVLYHLVIPDIPLHIVYEDEHVMVVNKAAGMVVHPGPGNPSGTLVNAILHHCNLPAIPLQADNALDDSADLSEEEEDAEVSQTSLPFEAGAHLRPGIVHRLDKGTTGLLVVAKDEQSLARLKEQFKNRSVQRTYQSITLGCPSPSWGQVATDIGRDARDRKKMGAYALDCGRGRRAVSGYRVVQPLAGGTAALVEWHLQTGRTHQIRVHAKHLGHPLFSDDTYGGAGAAAVKAVGLGKSLRQAVVWKALKELDRPALHAQTLGFTHPISGDNMQFTSELPADFQQALAILATLV